MSQETPSRKLDQYIVRFPDGMRDRLKDEAAKNNRSLNAEIVSRLEGSFALDGIDRSTFDDLIYDMSAMRTTLEGLQDKRDRMKLEMTVLENQVISLETSLFAMHSEVSTATRNFEAMKIARARLLDGDD